ncbi:DDE transposase family protein [[Phormidium ambiguum] IAM M-71]|uniref:DDE transposase family protein n=1 Tax=[Phormidium ambiguum] IAM M-71 TaxID=454136 RepID=A0A1U7II80_9CYAN|nr:DDE transposase family protein [Phormidium ambiguum]OKH36870.1 DDE transposase family protein [Phormidium ambiguum IAM M-71]
MSDSQDWYIIKLNEGNCDIVSSQEIEKKENTNILEHWGPFNSQGEAIARRVGLIRAGKCKPV